MKQPPKYKVGDHVGNLTVEKVLEHGYRHLTQARQWYGVRCECGNYEETTQFMLNRKSCCAECANDLRSQSKRENADMKRHIVKPDIPNFARMKLREVE